MRGAHSLRAGSFRQAKLNICAGFSSYRFRFPMTVAAAVLTARLVIGPFRSALITVNSPANAASLVAVAFILIILIAAKHPAGTISGAPRWNSRADLLLLAVTTLAAFWPNLRTPFVYDDYTHILQSAHSNWRVLLDAFQPVPGGHGLFFRPVGFVSYWLDYQWAGAHAVRWHLWSVAAHTANTCLVYFLVKRLGMRRPAALVAGLLFALHGSRAEAVGWSDARFDLLATFFALCALLAVCDYSHTGRRLSLVSSLACAALAVYAKESAFCLPLLPPALLPLLPLPQRRRTMAASLALGAVCAIQFAYRWWALGGIGGYVDRTGVSAVWHSGPLHTSEALFFRQWAFLFFPVNWSVPLEWWLRASAIAFIALLMAYVMDMRIARGSAAALLAGLAFSLAAALPVQHLLMFQTDFAGARVLYLPLAGLAIFWAALMEHSARGKLTWVTAAVLILFNVAALEHNLGPWRATPAAASAVCHDLGTELARDPRPVFVGGLPDRLRGVYFLSNGFPECVEMNSGQHAARVHVAGESETVSPGARVFRWNRERSRLDEVR